MTVRSVVYKIHEEVGRIGQVHKHCFALPSQQEGKHKLPISHIHLQVHSGVLSHPAANLCTVSQHDLTLSRKKLEASVVVRDVLTEDPNRNKKSLVFCCQ